MAGDLGPAEPEQVGAGIPVAEDPPVTSGTVEHAEVAVEYPLLRLVLVAMLGPLVASVRRLLPGPSQPSASLGRRRRVRSPQHCCGVQPALSFQSRRSSSLHRSTWPCQPPFGSGTIPYPASYAGRLAEGPAMGVPVSWRLSATGVRFLAILCPLADWASFSRLTGARLRAPDLTGLSRFARMRCGRGGCPLYPGDCGALTASTASPAATSRLSTAKSLYPGTTIHHPGLPPTRHHRGFTVVHPSGLPVACGPRMEQGPLGFYPELHTRRYRRRMSGWGQALGTRLGYVTISWPSNLRSHSICAPSWRTADEGSATGDRSPPHPWRPGRGAWSCGRPRRRGR